MTHVMSAETMRTMLASARNNPASLAMLLLEVAPARARSLALSMHERAAMGLDTSEIEHWACVVMEVARLEEAQRDAA
ncbi:MAG TPA: hypothetical protein VE690_13280 [Rhodopila sp.]|nr:hypothetical protein [Rhodopila sp.]